jgi:hypothetical protein
VESQRGTPAFTAAQSTPAVLVISPRLIVQVLSVCLLLLIIAALAGQIAEHIFGRNYLLGLAHMFDVNDENNVPTWFSTICLFLCALAAASIGLLERRRKTPWSIGWFILAGTFVFFSIDEAASMHEMVSARLEAAFHPSGVLHYPWVVPAGLFVAGLLFSLQGFFRQLPAAARRGLAVAASVYFGGCIVMEMLDGWYIAQSGHDFNFSLLSILEESLEMAGEVLLIRTLLAYLAIHFGSFAIQLRPQGRAAAH